MNELKKKKSLLFILRYVIDLEAKRGYWDNNLVI